MDEIDLAMSGINGLCGCACFNSISFKRNQKILSSHACFFASLEEMKARNLS
jgi:hypothetical protein